jgi:hypothetical protein
MLASRHRFFIFYPFFPAPPNDGSTPPPSGTYSPTRIHTNHVKTADVAKKPNRTQRRSEDIFKNAKEFSKSFLMAQRAIEEADINLNTSPAEPEFSQSPVCKKHLQSGPVSRSLWELGAEPIRRDHAGAHDFHKWAFSTPTNVLQK